MGHDPKRPRPDSSDDRDYPIGWGKPPRGRPFAPGQSGNPSGRKKRSKGTMELVDEELNRPKIFVIDGKRVKLSKRQIGAKSLAKQFAQGVPKAIELVLKGEGRRHVAPMAGDPLELQDRDHDAPLTPAELAVLALAADYMYFAVVRDLGRDDEDARA